MERILNFNAGPAELPPEVLHEAAKATRKYKNSGYSILELPHRGKDFLEIIDESKALVRELCGLDDNFEVLWLHGGGRQQFCMIPQNFLQEGTTAGYIDSGHWAAEAASYAEYYGDVQILSSSKDAQYRHLPKWPKTPARLAYVHITTNNTIYGTQWHDIPEVKAPLIADMSSDIFSRKTDYSRYSMFYAAAQKNLGIAGVALAVIRKDLLKKASKNVPPMMSYAAQVQENSILNTANVFGIYVSLLMLRWIKARGIDNIERENNTKATMLYDIIENSKVFTPYVTEPEHRSLMNVCFTCPTPELENAFLKACEDNSIAGVKGHRAAGGLRVSLYNAITIEAVQELVSVMRDFEARMAK